VTNEFLFKDIWAGKVVVDRLAHLTTPPGVKTAWSIRRGNKTTIITNSGGQNTNPKHTIWPASVTNRSLFGATELQDERLVFRNNVRESIFRISGEQEISACSTPHLASKQFTRKLSVMNFPCDWAPLLQCENVTMEG
jgi:hypothetical protein